MTISLNTFSKTGLATTLFTQSNLFSNTNIRLYPSTVPFPTSPVNSTPIAGHIVLYTGLTFSRSGNTISITAGTTASNSTAAGTLSWFSLNTTSSSVYGCLVSDSIGLSGSGGIITVNTLTPTNGQSVTITFNLTLV